MEQVTPSTHTFEPQAGPGLLVINGVELPVLGSVGVQDLARWASKITLGDYSYDSDQTMSTWVMSSFTGGVGNEKLKEGVDDETYWTGTLETRYPAQLTLPAYTHEIPPPAGGSGQAYPLADYPARAPQLYAAFGTTLGRWDNVGQTFVVVGSTLAGVPANKAVEYEDLLWIPMGDLGYATYDQGTDTLTNAVLPERLDVVAFTLWDNKLAALTTDGEIRLRYEGGTWEAAVPELKLPSSVVPKNMVVFVNQQQEPTIHVVTNTDVWAFDRENNVLYRTQLQFPPHPENGRASANWRGESMYVSVGLGIHSYNGGIVASMGLDGRYGLPANLRGTITDLVPEYNALIAVVQGQAVDTDYQQQYHTVGSQYEQTEFPYPQVSALTTVYRWVQSGWHPVWQAPDATGTPTWAHVSVADGKYRLWWGYGANLFWQKLPYTFHNPKQGMVVGENEFAAAGSLTTGWFDADMVAFDKSAVHFEVLVEDVFDTGLPTGEISVHYQVDDDPGFTFLGTTTQVGRDVYQFGVETNEYGVDFPYGQKFRRIRFRFDMASNNINLSPVMTAALLKFYKVPLSQLSFQVTVDLQQSKGFMNMGTRERGEFIRGLASAPVMATFLHRDRVYRVKVTQTNGSETTGYDLRSGMQLTLLEVPIAQPQLRAVPSDG